MPVDRARRKAAPSLEPSKQTLTLSSWSSRAEINVDLIGRTDSGIALWEHFSFPPGPEYPLWPAELLTFVAQLVSWWSEYVIADPYTRVVLKNCRPRFDYSGSPQVLPF